MHINTVYPCDIENTGNSESILKVQTGRGNNVSESASCTSIDSRVQDIKPTQS